MHGRPYYREAFAEAAPALGDEDAVFRAAGLVANGAWETDFDLGRIEDVFEGGDVLRALVDHAGDLVLIEEHVAGGAVFGGDVEAVEQGAVYDAAEADEDLAAFPLDFVGCGLFPVEPPEGCAGSQGNAGRYPCDLPFANGYLDHDGRVSEIRTAPAALPEDTAVSCSVAAEEVVRSIPALY